MRRSLSTLAAVLLTGAVAAAEDEPQPANQTCPVQRRPVSAAVGTVEYRGEHIGFCCPPCAGEFRADPQRYMNRMRLNPPKYGYASKWPDRAAMAEAAADAGAANGLCPVTGQLVKAEAGLTTYKRQRIGFSGAEARRTFLADPEPWMRAMRADPLAFGYDRPGPTHAQLRMAREAAGSVNGLCPVMGKLVKPDGGAAEYQGQRVGFCCPPCKEKFLADAAAFLGKMREEPAVYGYVPPR